MGTCEPTTIELLLFSASNWTGAKKHSTETTKNSRMTTLAQDPSHRKAGTAFEIDSKAGTAFESNCKAGTAFEINIGVTFRNPFRFMLYGLFNIQEPVSPVTISVMVPVIEADGIS